MVHFKRNSTSLRSDVRLLLLAGACSSTLAWSGVAQAQQQVADDTAPAGASAPQSGPTTGRSVEGIDEIIVTAQRRSESLQRTAIPIDVLSASKIDRAGLTSAAALSTLSPGVQIGGNGAFTQIFIRGIGDRSNTFLSNASVSTNLNGVPLLRSTEVNGNFFDLERVEILKGPQGTLYGRNATGGAVNILTARPADTLGGYLNGEVGSYDLKKVEGALNLPLSQTFALRGAFQVVDRRGYLSDGTNDDKQQNVRLSALWRPTEDVSFFLSGGYSHQGGKGASLALIYPRCRTGVCLDPYTGITDPAANPVRLGNNPPSSSTLPNYPAAGMPPQLNNRLTYLIGQLDWNLGPATLTVLPAYVRNRYFSIAYPGLIFTNDLLAEQAGVETRLSGETSSLKWVAGFFYTHEKQTGRQPVRQNDAGTGSSSSADITGKGATIDSKAGFAEATLSVTPSFRLVGGLRFTSETAGLTVNSYTCSLAVCPGNLIFAIKDKKTTTEKVSWKGGVEYDLTPDNFLYATYSTGLKAGGLYPVPTADPSYKPETIEAFTLGSRNRFLNGRLQINLEAYRWNYRNQVYNFVGPVPGTTLVSLVFINIGKGYVQGFSADVTARPWKGASLRLAAEYADSHYDEFKYDTVPGQRGPANTTCAVGPVHFNAQSIPVQTVDCSGRPFILSSKWSGSASYQQEFELASGGKIIFDASMTFNTKRYSQLEFLPTQLLPGAAVVDLGLGYESPSGFWHARAYVRNVTDVVTYSQSQSLTGTATATAPVGGPVIGGTIGAPRRFGVSAGIRF